jgi:hypothetical protein
MDALKQGRGRVTHLYRGTPLVLARPFAFCGIDENVGHRVMNFMIQILSRRKYNLIISNT